MPLPTPRVKEGDNALEIASRRESDIALMHAIEYATRERLVTVVKSLCGYRELEKHIKDALLDNPTGAAGGKKRPRYVICSQCSEEFDVSINDDTSCTRHPGTVTALLYYLSI